MCMMTGDRQTDRKKQTVKAEYRERHTYRQRETVRTVLVLAV